MQKGGTADLDTCNIASIAQLQQERGPYSGTVVAAGAAAGVLPEIGVSSVHGRTSEPLTEGSATWQKSWQHAFHFVA